jgi:hypothetical protein
MTAFEGGGLKESFATGSAVRWLLHRAERRLS